MAKQRRRYRRRQPKRRWITLENISLIKQFFVTVGPIVVGAYLWVIPEVEAKMNAYVRSQFVAVGMDPANIETLNKSLAELQETVKEKDGAVQKLSSEVNEMKVDIGKVLILLQTQAAPAPEPIK